MTYNCTAKYGVGCLSCDPNNCLSLQWVQMGTVNDIPTLLNSYPTTKYDYAIRYNGISILPVHISTWNWGLRVYPKKLYLQGDDGTLLNWGLSVWTQNTTDAESQKIYPKFYQRYYNKIGNFLFANGDSPATLFIKMNYVQWTQIAAAKDLVTQLSNYSFLNYLYGYTYGTKNIAHCFYHNTGSVQKLYNPSLVMQFDNGTALGFGTEIFSQGTTDTQSQGIAPYYYQRYLFQNLSSIWSNGITSPIMFAKLFDNPWVAQPATSDLDGFMSKFPNTQYEWGVNFFGNQVWPVVINSWNRGHRVSFIQGFLNGNDASAQQWANCLWTRGTDDLETKNAGGKLYHRLVTNTSRVSNYPNQGIDLVFYVRKFKNPWIFANNIQYYNDIVNQYPLTQYEYGYSYNTYNIMPIQITSWNVGILMHQPVLYFQGDDGNTMNYGTTVLTKGTLDSQTTAASPFFYHRYINQDAKESGSNGVINWNLAIYVRAL